MALEAEFLLAQLHLRQLGPPAPAEIDRDGCAWRERRLGWPRG
jgi:hypothetical protein